PAFRITPVTARLTMVGLLVGCAHVVAPKVQLAPPASAPLQLHAVLVLPDALRAQVDKAVQLGTDDWMLATGASLVPALERACRDAIADVVVVRDEDQATSADVAVILKGVTFYELQGPEG